MYVASLINAMSILSSIKDILYRVRWVPETATCCFPTRFWQKYGSNNWYCVELSSSKRNYLEIIPVQIWQKQYICRTEWCGSVRPTQTQHNPTLFRRRLYNNIVVFRRNSPKIRENHHHSKNRSNRNTWQLQNRILKISPTKENWHSFAHNFSFFIKRKTHTLI